jgi:hypothetical protein
MEQNAVSAEGIGRGRWAGAGDWEGPRGGVGFCHLNISPALGHPPQGGVKQPTAGVGIRLLQSQLGSWTRRSLGIATRRANYTLTTYFLWGFV